MGGERLKLRPVASAWQAIGRQLSTVRHEGQWPVPGWQLARTYGDWDEVSVCRLAGDVLAEHVAGVAGIVADFLPEDLPEGWLR